MLRFDPIPDEEKVLAFAHGYYDADPVAEAFVDEVYLNRGAKEGRRLLDQAIAHGVDSVPDAPEPMRRLFAEFEDAPAWLDPAKVDQGAALFRRFGPAVFSFAGVETLLGYTESSIVKPLALTGGYAGDSALNRFMETARFWIDVSEPGGLETGGAGRATAMRVRVMHVFIRRHISRAPHHPTKSPHIEEDTMSHTENCTMAATPADYQHFGLAKHQIAGWEDGFRTSPGGPGTFEWWYFDAVLDDGSTLVINFMVKDVRGVGGIKQRASPVVTFELDRPDGTHVERTFEGHEDFAFATDRCDVRVGNNTFTGDLHTYTIHVEIEDVTGDVTLTGKVPSWRPETGHMLFGTEKPHLFAWLPSVPQGAVEATLTVEGETRTLTGTGYHDHNWGDAAMPDLINHWYWARGEAGDYSVIASNITAEKKYGHTEISIFMLAKDGIIVADESSLVGFEKRDEQPDPVTGKPVANTTIYEYDATAQGGDHYRVTFVRENTIVHDRMIESVKGVKHVLAKLVGFDGAYMRFTGQVTVEHLSNQSGPETVTAPALWELMYFGKTMT